MVTIISRYARRASTVCGMSSFAKRLLRWDCFHPSPAALCRQQPMPSQCPLNISKFIYMILGCETLAMALLLPDSGWHHRLRMAMNRPAQVTGHQIDSYGRQHRNHAEPDPPIAMRPSPIWRLAVMNELMRETTRHSARARPCTRRGSDTRTRRRSASCQCPPAR